MIMWRRYGDTSKVYKTENEMQQAAYKEFVEDFGLYYALDRIPFDKLGKWLAKHPDFAEEFEDEVSAEFYDYLNAYYEKIKSEGGE